MIILSWSLFLQGIEFSGCNPARFRDTIELQSHKLSYFVETILVFKERRCIKCFAGLKPECKELSKLKSLINKLIQSSSCIQGNNSNEMVEYWTLSGHLRTMCFVKIWLNMARYGLLQSVLLKPAKSGLMIVCWWIQMKYMCHTMGDRYKHLWSLFTNLK